MEETAENIKTASNEDIARAAVDEASELEAPTDENSKTRYFTHLLDDFWQNPWSLRFNVLYLIGYTEKSQTLSNGGSHSRYCEQARYCAYHHGCSA